MLIVNKEKKELTLVNPTSFIALLSATALAFSGCSNKNEENNKSNIQDGTSQVLLAEENKEETFKYNNIVKNDWNEYKESVQDYIDSKSKNSMSKDDLETALIILNMSYLKTNNLSVLDNYYKNSNDIDQNDEMNQLYKLLSLVREIILELILIM